MPVIGVPREVHGRFKFAIEIDGFQAAFFQRMSELSVEAGVVEYREGGSLIAIKQPGLLTFPAVTLERGTSLDADFDAWMLEVADASAGTPPGVGLNAPAFKRNLSLIQRDRDNSELLRYDLFNAWPSKYVAGEWDNTANEVTIEMLQLEYDFFQRIAA